MSQEGDAAALKRFRSIYNAVSRGDAGAFLDSLDEDVVLHQTTAMPGTKGTFKGQDGAMELLDEIAESFTEIVWRPQRVTTRLDTFVGWDDALEAAGLSAHDAQRSTVKPK